MLDQVVKAYNEAVFDADLDEALRVVHQAEADGATPEDIVFKVVLPAMDLMVQTLEQGGGASLAQHYMTAHIADVVTTEVMAKFSTPPKAVGRAVIGTAEGDLHSLGKRIVAGSLKARMVEVFDLGTSVAPERFVDEAIARDAQVIAVSAMMMHTAAGERGARAIRELLDERCPDRHIRLVVGGAPYRFNPDLYQAVGADAWAENGVTAGKVIADMIEEVQR